MGVCLVQKHAMNLYRILVSPPTITQFNEHIKAVILPQVLDNNPEHIHYPREFVEYVTQIVLPSPRLQDKKFLCLLWFSCTPSYQKLLEPQPSAKLALFKDRLVQKLNNFVAGIQCNGDNIDFKTANGKQQAHKRTVGYFLDKIKQDFVEL